MSVIKRHIDDIEDLIFYAVKEGFLDSDEAENMSLAEKKNYYDKCQAYDPEQENL